MEPTESTVVQVAPAYENAKIKEMEMFGWSLQSRQEIHEEGEAYGRPSLIGNSYIVKTKVSQYVKLHFVRGLSSPNLDKIRQIESEYFSLQFPETSTGFFWQAPLALFGLIALSADTRSIGTFLVGGALLGGWVYTQYSQYQQNRDLCAKSAQRRLELIQELTGAPAFTGDVKCPNCGWMPTKDDKWSCSCGFQWNTFSTRAHCPNCGITWSETACLSCSRVFPHVAWYVVSPSSVELVESGTDGTSSATGKPAAEVRLKKLKQIFDAGFVTESEYEHKRTEILKDL